jgi:solute carrier family 35 (UDP-galactose transporter), member B1
MTMVPPPPPPKSGETTTIVDPTTSTNSTDHTETTVTDDEYDGDEDRMIHEYYYTASTATTSTSDTSSNDIEVPLLLQQSQPPPLRRYIPFFLNSGNSTTSSSTATANTTAHTNNCCNITIVPNYHTLQLLFGICGIYISFLYYGNLQEDIFRYTASTTNTGDVDTAILITGSTKFTQAWFLQAAESFINGCVGYIGIVLYGSGFTVVTTTTTNQPTSTTPAVNVGMTTIHSSSTNSTVASQSHSLPQHHFHPSMPQQHYRVQQRSSAMATTTGSMIPVSSHVSPTSVTILPNHYPNQLPNMTTSVTQPSVLTLSKPTLPQQQQQQLPQCQYFYHKVPHFNFCISGMAQVSAKACTSIALSYGLSYPIATLTKSGKMAPVMIGSIYYGNATYTVRDYVQVVLIIFGTAIVSFGSNSSSKHHTTSSSSSSSAASPSHESILGVLYILLSLFFDGITAGYQKRFQHDMSMMNVQPKSYDYMYYTNIYMCCTAFMIAALCNEITTGITFLYNNPILFHKIVHFTICSAIGQSFIFYTLANFDPLILSTVTTTRKIFSVLLSIFLKGHSLSYMGWTGITIACSGILSEMHHKMGKKKHTN